MRLLSCLPCCRRGSADMIAASRTETNDGFVDEMPVVEGFTDVIRGLSTGAASLKKEASKSVDSLKIK
tara:strand:- start:313 stop:516 length:204 start_codon:yes stop_codon:yes gene_type:complete